jgi:6-phosphofructokinase 1
MESVRVAPAPAAAAAALAEQKLKLIEQKTESLPPAAAKAPASACKWAMKKKLVGGDAGYVLEDVPHLTDYLPELPVRAPCCLAFHRFARVFPIVSFG